MLFERDEDYREIRGYHELSGGHRPGYMAVGEKLRISDANLSRLDTTAANLAEMRHAILEEKVRAILSAISNEYPDDVFERLIREERFPETFTQISARETTVPDHAYSTGEIARTFANAGAEERIILCRGLAHANDRMYRITEGEYDDRWVRMISDLVREEDHIEDDTTPDLEARVPRPVGERVAYLRNTYTDTAFETFSTVLRSAASTYYSDFPGVCEALYYDRATACILPLENSSDGKLLRFYSLLTRYDLRIAYVTSVTAYDTDVTTRYALLRRSVAIPHPQETDALGMYLECRVMTDEETPLFRILAAADAYHLSLTRADSVPGPYEDDDRTAYDLILHAEEGADFASMLTYCYLLVPGFTLLGIYLDL
ncbi:MAG: hypothetical protein E7604_04115 [Ruminococcaceae bacterium]|nr:hypothetical protein [Oscillospiraceae bacterium]